MRAYTLALIKAGTVRRASRFAAPVILALALTVGLASAPGRADSTSAAPLAAKPVASTDYETGIPGYRILDIMPAGIADNVISIDAMGPDGRVAGTMRVAGDYPDVFVWTPGYPYEIIPKVPGSVNHVGGFDAQGNLYGTAGGGVDVSNPAIWKWTPTGPGAPTYNDPTVLMPWSDFGKDALVEIVDVNKAGHLLIGGNVNGLVRGTSITLLSGLSNGRPGLNDLTDSDRVIGYTEIDPDGTGPLTPYSEPTVWINGGAPSSLGFPPIVNLNATGTAGNDKGQTLVDGVWGYDRTPFMQQKDGSWNPIQLPSSAPAGSIERMLGVNDTGDAIGFYGDNKSFAKALVWNSGKTTVFNDELDASQQGSWDLSWPEKINSKGMIVGAGSHDGSSMIWVAQPVDPVVFVHGAGASSIYSFQNGKPAKELWMDCTQLRDQLSLYPDDVANGSAPAESGAVDALRHETCLHASELVNPGLDIYGTLLDNLASTRSYREYKVAGEMSRQTTQGCDTSQASTSTPNLFVYAYDWRRDNAKNAQGLADYMGCIKKLWPGRKVDVLTHSMGSLVARRYIVDHMTDNNVDRMITIGAPWLGAPKLVNVLQTGDFAPQPVNGPAADIKRISGSFPAAHQLMAGRYYANAASVPVFKENGWDINNDGFTNQTYTFDDLKMLLNLQHLDTKPGNTAENFQAGAQTDWRDDTSGVKYTHIVGLQAGANTIGTVVANTGEVCSWWSLGLSCHTENYISQELVCGDGTVPLISAERAGKGLDYNAPNAEVLVYRSDSTSQNQTVEHTGLASNVSVDYSILNRLFSMDDTQGPQDHTSLGRDGDDTNACLSKPAAGLKTASLKAASTAVPAPAPGFSLRYVSVLNGTDLTVTDAHNHTTDPNGGTAGYVNGVTLFPSDRPDAGMATMPVSSTESYTTSVVATGKPMELTLLEGSQAHPTAATRWVDVSAPAGAKVELATRADGSDVLRVDRDGDGTAESVVAPTSHLGGADASDTTAPQLTATKLDVDGTTTVALSATDDQSGVDSIFWSTDGEHFQKYTAPLSLDASATTLTAFAQDRAGNRSAPYEVKPAELQPSMLTTASLDPAPTGAGWSAGAVTVTLTAQASTGTSPIASITYRVGTGAEKTVGGSTTSFDISDVGSTPVTFFATAADGTKEPERSVQVRVDGAAPSVTIKNPALNSVSDTLGTIAGVSSDDASGVDKVELELRDSQGRWWDGQAWTNSETWLPTSGTSSWSRPSGLPSGADLPTGGYRVRARATDGAGRSTTSAATSFTIAPPAGMAVSELSIVSGERTSALALNESGVAGGVTTYDGNVVPSRWKNGSDAMLQLSDGMTNGHVQALDDAGRTYGDQGSSTVGMQPVRWESDGSTTPLDTLATGSGGHVNAVTGDGSTAVGWSNPSVQTQSHQPVRWDGTKVQALAMLPNATAGEANGVAADGTIVGYETVSGVRRAVRWSGDTVNDLGTVGTDTGATATASNDVGEIVGTTTGSRNRAFVASGGTMDYLTTDFTGTEPIPHAVNNAGTIVGEYSTTSGTPHAFVAQGGQPAVDLNTLLPAGSGWVLMRANDVNDLGQIVGFGTHNGVYGAFLIGAKHAPVALDGAAKTDAGKPVEVSLDAYDPDVTDSLTLSIVGGPSHGTLSAITDRKVTYTPADGFGGNDSFTFVADDGELQSAVGTVTIEVTGGTTPPPPPPANNPPTMTISAPATATEGGTVTVTAPATDKDNDPLTWTWSTTGGTLSGSGDSAQLAVGDGPADITVTAEVSDGKATVRQSATIHVDNAAPVVDAGSDATVPWGVPLTLHGSVSDPMDVDAGLSPYWTFGDAQSQYGPVASHVWAQPGTYLATLQATDKDGASGSDTATITVVKHQPALTVAASGGVFGSSAVAVTLTDATDAGKPIAGRSVDVTVDGKSATVTTDAAGKATLAGGALSPGAHAVSAAVAEDARYLAAAAASATVTVTQSAGHVVGGISVKEGVAGIVVCSDGKTTNGVLAWTDRSGAIVVPIKALGVTKTAAGRPAAWFAGTVNKHSVLAYVEDNSATGKGDVFKLWIDGVAKTSTGARIGGLVTVR